MAFTKAQTDAMTARGRSLLVSAAAGSGKTFTLTRRIIDSIIADENKSIGRMLIVTFTRSAAAELKKKISDALTEAIAAHPDNKHLQEELLKLGSAHISTIDSFFSAPVKANFEKLGLPASIRLADDAELAPVREAIFKETLELFFSERSGISEGELAGVGHRSVYTDLLSLITGIRDTSGIIPTLLEFYKKTLSVPDGVDILKKSAERLRESAELDFFDTIEGKIILKDTKDILSGASSQLDFVREQLEEIADGVISADPSSPPAFALALKGKIIPTLSEDAELCNHVYYKLSESYVAFRDAIQELKFKNYPSLKGDNFSSYSDVTKNTRAKLLAPIKNLKKNPFCYSPEQISAHFLASAEACELLYALLSEFDRRYSAEKLARGVCEFSDMPKFVLKLLQNSDGTPSELAISMSKQYDEVYIDEYQDVNAIQDRIFELIGGNRRFMVGDIKQSIYCFRDAEPSIFAAYREKFPQYDSENPDKIPESGGNSIFMSENFRCDRGIVDFVNLVCDKIFFSFADSIGYDKENDMLRFGKISPNFDPPQKVKINLIEPAEQIEDNDGEIEDSYEPDENEDKLYDEAVICANEIARLIRDKNEKNADGSYVRAGDIAILVRGHKQIEPLAKALSKIGIKYVTNAKNELLQGSEMKLLLDILTTIDNPRDDIPLCRVLTAALPLYSPVFTLDEVIRIRDGSDEKHSLYDAMVEYATSGECSPLAGKCQEIVSLLNRLRKLSGRVSADKLLRALAGCEIFADLCTGDSFTYLYSTACKYSRGAWNGLYSFVTYFKSLMEKGDSNSDPIKAQDDEVTIITMHQSKGLEYKVCYLFGLGKQMNFRSLSSPLIFNRELGISLKLAAPEDENDDVYSRTHIKREENALWKAGQILSKNKMLEEEARIFYVAMTRAKERLYLSATLSKSYEEIKEVLSFNSRDFMNEIKNGKSYIWWTLIALSLFKETEDLYELNTFKRGSIPPLCDRITREEVESSAYGITDEDKHFAKVLLSPHGETDAEKLLSAIPAKVAASKVSGRMLDESVFIPIPTGELFGDNDEDRDEIASDSAEKIRSRINLMRSKNTTFDDLLETNKKPTAAEKGSAAHQILQFCDYGNVLKNGLDREIERLCDGRFITRRTADIVERKQLERFFESELFKEIRSAHNTRREFHFGMFRSAADFTEKDEIKALVGDKKIFVQGSIDLLIETSDGKIILCDYKTDRISPEEIDNRELLVSNMREKHKDQLDEYRFAVKEIFGKEPSKTYIYSIPMGEVIEI